MFSTISHWAVVIHIHRSNREEVYAALYKQKQFYNFEDGLKDLNSEIDSMCWYVCYIYISAATVA